MLIMNSGPTGSDCPACGDRMAKVRSPDGTVFEECLSCLLVERSGS